MVGPLEGFADVWGAVFFKQVYGFDQSTANSLPSIIFMGMCFGGPLLSIMAEKTANYLGFIMGAGFVMLLVFIALIAGVLTINSITLSFILVGICCSYQIIAIYKASTYVDESMAGLTNAVANMIIMSFGYAFHTVIGFIVKFYGGIEKAQSLIYGVGIIPVALAIGTTGFFVLFYQERRESKGV